MKKTKYAILFYFLFNVFFLSAQQDTVYFHLAEKTIDNELKIKYYKKAIKKCAQFSGELKASYYYRGMAYFNIECFEKSIRDLEKSLEIEVKSSKIWANSEHNNKTYSKILDSLSNYQLNECYKTAALAYLQGTKKNRKNPYRAYYYLVKVVKIDDSKSTSYYQYHLGLMSYNGDGCTCNRQEGLFWLKKSYDYNCPEAIITWNENKLWKHFPKNKTNNQKQNNQIQEHRVYVCGGKYAKKYHSRSNCPGLNNCQSSIFYYNSQSEALQDGYSACAICWR